MLLCLSFGLFFLSKTQLLCWKLKQKSKKKFNCSLWRPSQFLPFYFFLDNLFCKLLLEHTLDKKIFSFSRKQLFKIYVYTTWLHPHDAFRVLFLNFLPLSPFTVALFCWLQRKYLYIFIWLCWHVGSGKFVLKRFLVIFNWQKKNFFWWQFLASFWLGQ